jgi:hypothetical protein
MLAFLQSSREDDMKRKDTAKQFTEEQKVEDQRRHNEFLEVLKEYTTLGNTTLVGKKGEEGGGSLLDLFGDSKKLLSLARLLTPLLVNPLTLTLGAILAAAYGLQKAVDFIPNAKILTPLEAQAALGGSERDIAAFGGYDFLSKRITEGPEEAQKTLDDFAEGKISFKELQKRGGETKLKEIAAQKGLEVPAQKQTQLPNSVPPRPTGTGLDVPSMQKNWDNLYGENYNTDGTRKATQVPNTDATPAPAATQVPNVATPPVPAGNQPSAEPVAQTPVSTRMNNAVDENQNLNLESYDSGSSGSVAPVISSNSSSVDLPDKPIPATATVRDTTPIFAHVMQGYLSPV